MAVRWFSMSTQFLTDPKVEDLGERFGPAGPLVVVALLGRAKIADDAGRVTCSFRTLGNEAFVDRATAREIVADMIKVGLVEAVSESESEASVRFLAWRRWQDAGRKARERESREPTSQANVRTRPEVSRPVPTDKTDRQDKKETKEKSVGPTDAPLSHLLADLVAENDPDGKRPKVTRAWAVEEDRMLRLDGRKPEEAKRLLEWVHRKSTFWRKNILSMPTFRERYGQLYLDAVSESEKKRGRDPAPGMTQAEQRAEQIKRKREARAVA